MIKALLGALTLAALVSSPAYATSPPAAAHADWPVYGGDSQGDRYSPLDQVNRRNVRQLRQAWRYDMTEPGDSETSPIVVDGTLYGYTPDLKVVALDAATGTLRWKFAPDTVGSGPSRGVTWWSSGRERRVLAGVMNFLYALDPASGKPIDSFGEHGRVDLRKGLGRDDYADYYVSLTSPGALFGNLLIVGFRTAEISPAAPGDIRAYDVRTGKLRWSFHTIPRQGEAGHESWPVDAWKTGSAANAWTGFVIDQRRGIVYIPTGSAASDFYGADRVGNDLFANTLLALDARTGRMIWHFQGVHHDLWDRDFPAPPVLLTVRQGAKVIDAVAQPTKQGYLYVFDRTNGNPLFPIVEKPYPGSVVPGEVTSATQPASAVPAPYARQRLTEQVLTNRTPAAHDWAVNRFKEFRSDGQFVPLGLDKPTVIFPGFDGGAEWGGEAVDTRTGVIYINSNDIAWTGMLVKNVPNAGLGATLYQANCSSCHGPDRKGSPPAFPSLIEAAQHLSPEQMEVVVQNGRGRMPPFRNIQSYTLKMLIHYVVTGEDLVPTGADVREGGAGSKQMVSLFSTRSAASYAFTGYSKFLDPDGYPAVAPPWGTLNAIDLNTGRYLWKVPLGEYPELAAQGLPVTGSENYGGPVVTAGGLVLIGATVYDSKLRAFDSRTGGLLWETQLPFAGTATPATYAVNGKQYIVIETNNSRNRKGPQGAAYVAYALP